jgi:hypothetical protein
MSLLSVYEQFGQLDVDANSSGKRSHLWQDQILGADLQDVERLAVGEGFSAYHACCAAWAIVLSRHTAQDTVRFASISRVSADEPEGGGPTIRKYVQASINEDVTFSEFLHEFLDVETGAFPTESRWEASILAISSDADCFDSTNFLEDQRGITDVSLCLFFDKPERISLSCCYNPRISNEMSWSTLKLVNISMLSLREEMGLRRESLPGRNLAEMRYGSVHQMVRLQVQKTPLALALEGEAGNLLSYADMDHMSDLMAEDLRMRLADTDIKLLDAGPGVISTAIVAVMLQRSPNIVISILTC